MRTHKRKSQGNNPGSALLQLRKHLQAVEGHLLMNNELDHTKNGPLWPQMARRRPAYDVHNGALADLPRTSRLVTSPVGIPMRQKYLAAHSQPINQIQPIQAQN